MKVTKLISMAVLGMALVGCGSNPNVPHTYKDENSRAKNIAWPAGYTRIQDAKADPALAQVAGNNKGLEFALMSGHFAANGGLMGLVSPMSAINVLSLLESKEAWEMPSVFGWMPREIADNPSDAYLRYFETLSDALDAAVVERGNDPKLDRFRRFEVSWSKRPRLGQPVMDGSVCTEQKLKEGSYACTAAVNMRGEAVEVVAPEMLGGFKAWGFLSQKGIDTSRLRFSYMKREGKGWDVYDEGKAPVYINELEYWVAFSKNLPKGLFVYLPPGKVSVDSEGSRLGMPVVLEQGKLNFFIKPVPSDAVAQAD